MKGMTHIVTVLVACIAVICWIPADVAADDLEDRIVTSRAAVKSLAKNIKGYLKAALDASISVEEKLFMCKAGASEATSQEVDERQFSVGRTSLRVRNPENTPDEWEHAILEKFQARKDAGEKISNLEHAEMVDANGHTRFRYMKAIPVGQVCVMCHGKALDLEVIAALDKIYPNDQARGFEIGEIRGAFTIAQPIK
ncbi:MAG TPA: DUF3365 domain-containing protein [Alphaproteobacteria bacterium]|nr:DUF3365 domain-containing protein [Alphaproteobacteria bacterium]